MKYTFLIFGCCLILIRSSYANTSLADDLYFAKPEKLEKLAKSGNAKAQFFLGQRYYLGLGVKKDYNKAFALLSTSASQGARASYGFLGILYSEGKGTEKNANKGIYYLTKSAEDGEGFSASRLAFKYRYGIDLKKDYVTAIKWYNVAIEHNINYDLLQLGEMYQEGNGVQKDYSKAMELYKKAKTLEIDGSDDHINKLEHIMTFKYNLYGRFIDKIKRGTLFDYAGLVSFFLAIYLYFRSKKEKIPFYDIRSTALIKDHITQFERLSISYNERKIDNLSITKLAFWNAGRDTIKQNDIAQASPLRVSLVDGIILDAKVTNTNSVASSFTYNISEDNKSMLIKFDYIDKGNIAIYEILHTSKQPIIIEGSIIGSRPVSKSFLINTSPKKRITNIIGSLITAVVISCALFGVIYKFDALTEGRPPLEFIIMATILGAGILLVLTISSLFSLVRSKPLVGFDLDEFSK